MRGVHGFGQRTVHFRVRIVSHFGDFVCWIDGGYSHLDVAKATIVWSHVQDQVVALQKTVSDGPHSGLVNVLNKNAKEAGVS